MEPLLGKPAAVGATQASPAFTATPVETEEFAFITLMSAWWCVPCSIGAERLFGLRARLDVRAQPRLECVDRRVWFARTFGKLLEVPGER
jgi:hypothetical protein